MTLKGFVPNSKSVISILRSHVDLGSLELGRSFHSLIDVYGLGEDRVVSISLLMMYCKLGCMQMARLLYDQIEERDSTMWNVMILGYAQNKLPDVALCLLVEVGKSGCRADLFMTIAYLASVVELNSCTR